MKLVGVQFNGETVLGPAAINSAAAGGAIRDRKREPVIAEKLQKPGLEAAECHVDVSLDDSAELASSPAPWAPIKNPGDRVGGEPIPHPSLMAGASQCMLREQTGDLDDRPRHAGHGDPAAYRGVARIDVPGSLRPDPVNASLFRADHFWWRSRPLHKPPQMCGREAT